MSFLNDLFSLDVVTVTGDFKVKIEDTEISGRKKKRNVIDFDEMFNDIKGTVDSEAKLRILAATRVELDRDTYHFVSSKLKDEEIPLVKMHFDAVSSAIEGRSGIAARLKPGGRDKKKGGDEGGEGGAS